MLTHRSPDKRPDVKDTTVIRDGVPHPEQGKWCIGSRVIKFMRDLRQIVSHSNLGSHLTDSSKATRQSRYSLTALGDPPKKCHHARSEG